MKKKPEEKRKAGLLVVGLLTAFCVLDFSMVLVDGSPRYIVSRSFARATVCAVLFLYLLYQRRKNREQ